MQYAPDNIKGESFKFNGSNCDRTSQLTGITTQPLNHRDISKHKLRALHASLVFPLRSRCNIFF